MLPPWMVMYMLQVRSEFPIHSLENMEYTVSES